MQDLDHVPIPLVLSLMVQPTHDMHFGTAVFERLFASLQDLLVVHRIPFVAPQIGTKRAKHAAVNADVGRVQMGVNVVVGAVAIDPFTDEIGKLAQIVDRNLRIVHRNAIVEC